MTLTAPIPLPTFGLADAIRAGIHPIGQTAHLPENIMMSTADAHDAALAQLRGAQARVRRAIERRLTAVDVRLDEGRIEWTLGRETHGDGWMLEGVWTVE